MGPWHVSPRQAAAFDLLVADVVPQCRLIASPDGVGRGLSRLRSLCKQLEALDHNSTSSLESLAAVAQPLTVSHIKTRIPEHCGACDPRNILNDPDKIHAYENQHLSLDPDLVTALQPPAVQITSIVFDWSMENFKMFENHFNIVSSNIESTKVE